MMRWKVCVHENLPFNIPCTITIEGSQRRGEQRRPADAREEGQRAERKPRVLHQRSWCLGDCRNKVNIM